MTTTNTINAANTVVTMTPASALTEGAEYFVKIKDGVLTGGYEFNVKQKSFIVSSKPYVIYDGFTKSISG